jgi:predicted phosphodiesterase
MPIGVNGMNSMINDAISGLEKGNYMTSILHFSDIHHNRRAVKAVWALCRHYVSDIVAITGDVCSVKNPRASDEFDYLPNPRVFLVPGNHDDDPQITFSHLRTAEWHTPLLDSLSNNVAILNLNSEQPDINEQLYTARFKGNPAQTKCAIVSHHRPYSSELYEKLISRLKNLFPSLISVIYLHGHAHHLEGFYSKLTSEQRQGIQITVSNVYSANVNVDEGKRVGCANRFLIDENGMVAFDGPKSILYCNPDFDFEDTTNPYRPDWYLPKSQPDDKLESLVDQVFSLKGNDRWIPLSAFRAGLKAVDPSFSWTDFGFDTINAMISQIDNVLIEKMLTPQNEILVRRKK